MNKRFKRILMSVFSMIAIALLLGAVPACGTTPTTDPSNNSAADPASGQDSSLKYVAHRGYSQSYVDNTEASFRAAAEMSFYGIETDIRKTKDGYYVCSHDATVKYADGREVAIASTSRADLLSSPIKNTMTSEPAYLCTFEKYLQICKEGGKVAFIELKDHFSKAETAEILAIVDNEYDCAHTCFISFIYSALLHVKEADPSIKLQYLSQTENDFVFDHCLEEGISVRVRKDILTEDMVMLFHDEGREVNVWTVNENSYLTIARKRGVDYVTSNVFSED